MPQEIGWSVEAKLLYQIKQLTKQLSGRQYILTFPTFASFPTPGITGTLYVDEATGDIYVWNGTSYVILSSGITALNGLIAAAQLLTTGSTGTDFNISSVGTTHTFNIPTASATNRGLLSSTDWTTFNSKQNALTFGSVSSSTSGVTISNGTSSTVGPNVTVNIATASGSQTGLLSSTDWTTFNNKQNALTNPVTGTGTTNYVPKFTASTTLGNSQIFADANGVGIGITDPSSYLTGGRQLIVANTPGAAGVTIRTSNTGDGSIFFSDGTTGDETYRGYVQYIHASDALRLGTSATERLRITSGGVVAINTQSPDAGTILHTARGSNGTVATFGIQGLTINPRIRIDASETNNTVSFNTNYNGATSPAITFLTSEAERLRIFANGRIGVNTTTDAGYQFDVNGTLRSVNGANFATTSGNVGVGVTNPDGKLEVLGGTLTAGTVGTYALLLGNGTRQLMSFGTDGNNGYIQTWGARNLNLNSQGNNTIINSGSGEVFIGTTTDAGDYKLQVAGNIYSSGLAAIGNTFINTNSPFVTGANIYTNGQSLALGTQGANLLAFFTNNTQRAYISSAGEFIIDASASDAGDYKLQVVGNQYLSGKLVVGTTTDIGYRLQVVNTNQDAILIQSTGTSYVNVNFRNTNNTQGYLQYNEGDFSFWNSGIQSAIFYNTSYALGLRNGTAPIVSVTDRFLMYSQDTVAGNAAPHFRTENGAVIKLYQETTGIAAATLVSNAGTALTSTDTFDGYTLQQIVKALRNLGILA